MIEDQWTDEIITAINEMVDVSEIKKMIRDNLQRAYDAGYDDARTEFEE